MNDSPPISPQAAPFFQRNWMWVALIAVTVFVLDVLTKIWAVHALKDEWPIRIIPGFFSLEYSENTGIAFGLFNDYSALLHILTPLAFLVLLIVIYRQFGEGENDWLSLLFVGLIIGGALGNILNRLYLGYVVDFILLYYKSYHWPNFNLADTALTIGELIVVYKIFFSSNPEPVKDQPLPENVKPRNNSDQKAENS